MISGHTANANGVNGIAGYTAQWDSTISDARSEPHPGSGNAFYSGPATPNSSTGSSDVASAGQGCHTLYVYAWDNAGFPSGNQSYGAVCHDTIAPVTSAVVNGTMVGSEYNAPVTVVISANDPYPGSGIAATYYELDSGGFQMYSGAIIVNSGGAHTVYFYSVDAAGNVETLKSTSFVVCAEQRVAQEG
jgi:hypothetical protein